MPTRLIALHGFTMNGSGLRHMLAGLEPRLADVLDFTYPDAPHTASAKAVADIASLLGGARAKPPNLEWWNASDDYQTYHGWHATRDLLRATAERPDTANTAAHGLGLLGFSQGAAVAATLAALSQQGGFPALRFVVLVAGFLPRATDIAPLFDVPIEIPSLHVWGQADRFAKHSPALFDRFAKHTRQQLTWPGPHTIPDQGSAGDTLVEFMRQHA